ncbi:hypothetical protein J6590_055670 [Homalodisca vitripennis]|nr:hypothetical protein J6590_055670 [Homalodisca vitripennis]
MPGCTAEGWMKSQRITCKPYSLTLPYCFNTLTPPLEIWARPQPECACCRSDLHALPNRYQSVPASRPDVFECLRNIISSQRWLLYKFCRRRFRRLVKNYEFKLVLIVAKTLFHLGQEAKTSLIALSLKRTFAPASGVTGYSGSVKLGQGPPATSQSSYRPALFQPAPVIALREQHVPSQATTCTPTVILRRRLDL